MTKETVLIFLAGKDNHLHPLEVLAHCRWEKTGELVGDAPHSIYRILNHIIYWQNLFLERIAGGEGKSPVKPSTGWPGEISPANEQEWMQAVQAFQDGFDTASKLASQQDLSVKIPTFSNMTLGECIVFLAQHNNHHFGQIITMCQVLGTWPASDDDWAEYE